MTLHLVDVGSTSIKYARYDPGTHAKFDAGSIPFPPPVTQQPPLFEVDIHAITDAVRRILRPAQAGDRILLSVQMHGYVLCDAEGQPVTPYISWRDRRATLLPAPERMPRTLPPTRGVAVKDNLPLAGLFAMRRLLPELWRQARMFCSLGAYLSMAFCGCNASHITDLAATGLYDAETAALAEPDAPNLAYPTAYAHLTRIGTWQGAAWMSPVGDQQASVRGSGLQPDQYLLNLGTAAQMCALDGARVYGDYESRPYFDGGTLCTVSGLIGGRDYAYWMERVGEKTLAENYRAALERLPPRGRIRAVGGVCQHHRAFVEKILNSMGCPWEIHTDADALDGLIGLYKEEE